MNFKTFLETPDIDNDYYNRASKPEAPFNYSFERGNIEQRRLILFSGRTDYKIAVQRDNDNIIFFLVEVSSQYNVGRLRTSISKNGFITVNDVSIGMKHRGGGERSKIDETYSLGTDLYKTILMYPNCTGIISDATLTKIEIKLEDGTTKTIGSYQLWKNIIADKHFFAVSCFDRYDLSSFDLENNKQAIMNNLKPVENIDDHIGTNEQSKKNIRFVAQSIKKFKELLPNGYNAS